MPTPADSPIDRPRRIEGIDFARGVAICLMILSHGVNGLLSFEQFTPWGLVPIHALTKFASSLFIMVFGIALAVAFVPHALSPDWPRRRTKLLLRGLLVLFWYKMLTIAEMIGSQPPQAIVDALLYRSFPSYVEILGFYAIALLWLPFVLPLWARAPALVRWLSPAAMAVLAWLVSTRIDFGEHVIVQALLVEHPDYYTWGQLSRGPLVLAGLLIGGVWLRGRDRPQLRCRLAAALAALAAASLALFFALAGPSWHEELVAIAHNAGKHPPEPMFMLFSVGGALAILALSVAGGERLARALRPVTLIGTNALQAFIVHIVVIFVGLRYLLGLNQAVSYPAALALTIGVMALTAAWIALVRRVQRRS